MINRILADDQHLIVSHSFVRSTSINNISNWIKLTSMSSIQDLPTAEFFSSNKHATFYFVIFIWYYTRYMWQNLIVTWFQRWSISYLLVRTWHLKYRKDSPLNDLIQRIIWYWDELKLFILLFSSCSEILSSIIKNKRSSMNWVKKKVPLS